MFIVNLIVNSLAVFITAYLLEGVTVKDFPAALVVSILLGIVNAIIKPILLLFTLPLTILTLGLFTFVINALMVMLVSLLYDGFKVEGFLWALLFSLVLSVVNSLLSALVKK